MYLPNAYATAISHHRAGNLSQAEAIYEAILVQEPAHADSLHLLGLIAHQRGQHDRAIELISRAIDLRNDVPAYFSNLAEAQRNSGKYTEAVASCRKALELDPPNLEARLNLARALGSDKQRSEAEAVLQEAVKLAPNDARAHYYFGECQRELGRLDDAIAAYRMAISLNPNHAHAHAQLGSLLMQRGNPVEAEPHLQRAVVLMPRLGPAVGNLGRCLFELGREREAADRYREALGLSPNDAILRVNVGQALLDYGQFREAKAMFDEVLQNDPLDVHALCGLADLEMEEGRVEEALPRYEQVLRLDPMHADARRGLTDAFLEIGEVEKAVAGLRRVLPKHDDQASLHARLGNILATAGDLEQATTDLRRALQSDPRCVPAFAGLATTLRARLPQDDIARMESLLTLPLNDNDKAALHLGLAHVYDAQSEFALATDHMTAGNAAMKRFRESRRQSYDPDRHSAHVGSILHFYGEPFFDRVAGAGNPSDRPVFVIGMPRSGTTLVEQILASHPKVHGAGERRFVQQSLKRLPEQLHLSGNLDRALELLTPELVRKSADWHLDQLDKLDEGKATRIVDKMPDNYLNLGWIAATFPNARIIHCRRDARDVALSCYLTNFSLIRWAHDLTHIAQRILDYQRTMAHWHKVLPIEVFEVDYERLVSQQESESRRMIDFLGLRWSKACLTFYKTDRLVRTASVTQVRQPMYSRSVGRWKNYEGMLKPLIDILDTAPR